MGTKKDGNSLIKRIRIRIINTWDDFFFLFFSYRIKRVINGTPIRILINDRFSKWWYSYQEKWTELKLIREHLLKPGDVVVDCGANIGVTSVYFSKVIGEKGKVFAFEALPKNAETIRKNSILNEVSNVEVVNNAVGETNRFLWFTKFGNGAIANTDKKNSIKVEEITLDSYFQEKMPDVIKIDVEGYEFEVLKGADKILTTLPRLALELHIFCYPEKERKLKEILDYLIAKGYKNGIIQKEYEGLTENCNLETLIAADLIENNIIHLFLYPNE